MSDIPLEHQLWTGDMVAEYLHMKPRTVKEKILVKPAAPRPIKVMGGHPRWKAIEIIKWAESFQDKKRATR